MGLLKTLLTIMLFYYFFKLTARLVAPILLKRFIQKTHDRFNKQYKEEHTQDKEGSITVESTKKEQTSTRDVGEYVDFEEVD